MARRRASAPSRRTQTSWRWRCCRAERSWSASRNHAKLWTLDGTLERTFRWAPSAQPPRAARGGTSWSAFLDQVRLTTSTGARPPTSACHSGVVGRCGTPDASTFAGTDSASSCERRRKIEAPQRAHHWVCCPTASASSAARRPSAWAPRRHLREHLELHAGPTAVALPDNQHALRLTRPHRQALQRQRRRQPHLQARGQHLPGCCPTASASSAARPTRPRASSSTALRHRQTKPLRALITPASDAASLRPPPPSPPRRRRPRTRRARAARRRRPPRPSRRPSRC